MKRVWAYLKEKGLRDPEDKQWFTPDEIMAPVFGDKKIRCFGMLKYLQKHLTGGSLPVEAKVPQELTKKGPSTVEFNVSPELAKIIGTKNGEKITRSQVGN